MMGIYYTGYFRNIFCVIIISFLLLACSQERNTLLSRTYHNTTAHYNAYFLAREKMKEVDAQLWKANKDDYNKILNIYPTIDNALKTSINGNLEEIIKKAALPVTKHKNSEWVDDSYILIGKSRLYQADYKLALETFKYVNTKGEDINARHQALVLLMRTFIDSGSYDNSNTVFDYLVKQKSKINKKNLGDLLLTKAYYHAKQEEYNKMPGYLKQAIPYIKKREYKARIHFIIGQIFQLMAYDKEAFKHYNLTLKNNPPYELSFYSKLNMAQVTELSKSNDKKRVTKYFKKLLKDKKNVDYKDKIYYEMGMFEFKQGNIPGAIGNFEKSLRQKSPTNFQKAITYLRLGRVYYENLKNFEVAKLYYDSTVAVMDKKDKIYPKVADRQKVLEEFVKQLRIVQKEDSLQRLAKLDSAALNKVIEAVIKKEKDERELQAKREKAASESANSGPADNQFANDNLDFSNRKWYFYNSIQIVAGKKEFEKRWGKRKLEDNWRRSTKEVNFAVNDNDPQNASDTLSQMNEKADAEEVQTEKEVVVDKSKYFKDIPYTQAAVDSSNKRLSTALYKLGKIYNQKLEEQENAIQTFDKLLTRFPEYEKTPEVLYFLYLIYNNKKDHKAEEYKERLFRDFPSSLYAKLIKNPNYLLDSKIANQEAAKLYRVAFDLYKEGKFYAADSMIRIIKIQFPENDLMDKMDLLHVVIVGNTKNALVYKNEIEEYIHKYPKSPLAPKAHEMLAATTTFIEDRNKRGRNIDSLAIRFSPNLDEVHCFGFSVNKNQLNKLLLDKVKGFNRGNSKYKDLKIETLTLNDSISILTVKDFEDKNDAKRYLIELKNENGVLKGYQNFNESIFIITKHNLNLLSRSKYLNGYLQFYKENY